MNVNYVSDTFPDSMEILVNKTHKHIYIYDNGKGYREKSSKI